MKKTSMTDMELSNISAGKGRAFIPPDAKEKDMKTLPPSFWKYRKRKRLPDQLLVNDLIIPH